MWMRCCCSMCRILNAVMVMMGTHFHCCSHLAVVAGAEAESVTDGVVVVVVDVAVSVSVSVRNARMDGVAAMWTRSQ
jgi:hypothetical protein